jgi:predicted HD phosphohydrolase
MKQRTAKKLCKKYIKEMGLKVIATHGRTFVVEPDNCHFCSRWYMYIVVSREHENLDKLIQEGKTTLSEWKTSAG